MTAPPSPAPRDGVQLLNLDELVDLFTSCSQADRLYEQASRWNGAVLKFGPHRQESAVRISPCRVDQSADVLVIKPTL